MRLKISPLAKKDVLETWHHIAPDNTVAANRIVVKLNDKFKFLLRTPFGGRARPEIREDVRGFPVGDYLIVYRILPGVLEILRVVHGARNLEELFSEDK